MRFIFYTITISAFYLMCTQTSLAKSKADTVRVGIYITSVHDIDFKQKEYTVNFWLWLKYNKQEFDFYNNLEVPQAKTVNRWVTEVPADFRFTFKLWKEITHQKNLLFKTEDICVLWRPLTYL